MLPSSLRPHRHSASHQKTSGDLCPAGISCEINSAGLPRKIVAIRFKGFRFFTHVLSPYLVLVGVCARRP